MKLFKKLQLIKSVINYIRKGEKFTQQVTPQIELEHIIMYRHELKDLFHQNRLLFPIKLCEMIDKLLPNIDEFIETYERGLMPEPSEEDKEFYRINNEGHYIAGFWSMGAFDPTLNQIDQVSKEIEVEFRKIYGTND